MPMKQSNTVTMIPPFLLLISALVVEERSAKKNMPILVCIIFILLFGNVVLNASLLAPNYKQIRELITDSNPLPDLDHSPRLSSRHFSIDGDGNASSMSDKRAMSDFDALLQQAKAGITKPSSNERSKRHQK